MQVVYKKEVDSIKITLRDSGVGVPCDTLYKLRKLFSNTETYLFKEKIAKNSTGGALGLTIASALVTYLSPHREELKTMRIK